MSKSFGRFASGMVFGAVAGYVISLFVPTQKRNKQKKQLEKLAQDFEKLLTDPKERDRVKEIFANYTNESVMTYRQAKSDLALRLAKLKSKALEIDKTKYKKAVAETIEHLQSSKSLPEEQIKKMTNMFIDDFSKLKEAVIS